MATKTSSLDHGASPLHLPGLSPSDRLLASALPLPPDPCFVYATFMSAASATQATEFIEIARRRVLSENEDEQKSIVDSVLPAVHIGSRQCILYLFAICPEAAVEDHMEEFRSRQHEGLAASSPSYFTPTSLYPCSASCSERAEACPACLTSTAVRPSSSSAACLLPRVPLRRPFKLLLEAIRTRLISDAVNASTSAKHKRIVKRYKSGFMLGPTKGSSEWGAGWEHYARSRELVHCHLELHLAPTTILVQPLLRRTHFVPLPLCLPLSPGAPLSLMPLGTPAYFLATYSGPSGALNSQFRSSLSGLGAGDWATPPTANGYTHMSPAYNSGTGEGADTDDACRAYLIVWIDVQNKQGEDKGISAIWPARLALGYSPSAPTRPHLPHIPELPSQLQPSPPPPPPSAPISILYGDAAEQSESPLTPRSSEPNQPWARPLVRRAYPSSSSGGTLRAFRTLQLDKTQEVGEVAVEIGSYVDSVARERERERERLRKERESGASPNTVPASGSTTEAATASKSTAAGFSRTGDRDTASLAFYPGSLQPPSSHSHGAAFIFAAAVASNDATYPSPHAATPANTASNFPAVQLSNDAPDESMVEDAPDPGPLAQIASGESPHGESYDAFEDVTSEWPTTTNDVSDFMDLGFGTSYDLGGAGGGVNDDLTDDDFSFWERPSADAKPAPTLAQITTENSVADIIPAAGLSPDGVSPPPLTGIFPGSNQFAASPTQQSFSPWTSQALPDGFSPGAILADSVPPAPDLLPPSPTKTPSSHSAPVTPDVYIENDFHESRQSQGSSLQPPGFEPISFSASHTVADGKYLVGKFAILHAQDDKQTDKVIPPPYAQLSRGWLRNYCEATDPRVGVMRQLIGMKRKIENDGRRSRRSLPSWMTESEEWLSTGQEHVDDAMSDSGSESDDDDAMEDEDSPMFTRPSTPLPSYLPNGPSLLHTHFHHSQLLPLSTPLRPPGAAVAPTNIASAAAAASVPTPVSPAALLGAASEKSKSLEAAACTVAKEVVENSVWADAWLSNATSSKSAGDVWSHDAQRIVGLLDDVRGLNSSLDAQNVFNLPSPNSDAGRSSATFKRLEQPLLSVGKSDAVIQVLPSALRFWEKLGLSPRAGPKDVTAFVLYEEENAQIQVQMEKWLNKIAATYYLKGLGKHALGQSSLCSQDGLFPTRLDSLRKTLPSFLSSISMEPSGSTLVLYIITPSSSMSLASPLLRHIFTALRRALKTSPDGQLVFHYVPEHALTSIDDASALWTTTERVCYSVYDRILLPVDRAMSRALFNHIEKVRNFFHDPAFTIARSLVQEVKLHSPVAVHGYNVVDRFTLLHVGYQLTPCGKWLLAACVDQRGEAHDFGVWLNQSVSDETFVSTQVWTFAMQFARQANIEWRIVITKLGSMSGSEVEVWTSHLASVVAEREDSPEIQVHLLSATLDTPWTFLTSGSQAQTTPSRNRSASKDAPAHLLLDASATTYACFPGSAMSTSGALPCGDRTEVNFIAESDDVGVEEDLPILPLATAVLIRVPATDGLASVSMLQIHLLHSAGSQQPLIDFVSVPGTMKDVIHNFHELSVLARERWRMDAKPILPFHLAAVEVMGKTMDLGNFHAD